MVYGVNKQELIAHLGTIYKTQERMKLFCHIILVCLAGLCGISTVLRADTHFYPPSVYSSGKLAILERARKQTSWKDTTQRQEPIEGNRYLYTGTPVVEQMVQAGMYDIYLCAFDIGHDVNIITYAVLHSNETLYQDKVRILIRDQDGHSLTVDRDHLTGVLDEPIRWTYHQAGRHEVTVELNPVTEAMVPASASFIVPLAHDDSSTIVLMVAFGIIVTTVIVVMILKWKQQTKG